jgi:hypothetical protein
VRSQNVELLARGEPWGTRIVNATHNLGIGWDLHEVTLRLSSQPLPTRDAPPVPARTRLEWNPLRSATSATFVLRWSTYRRYKQALAKRAHYHKRKSAPPEFQQLRL